MDFLFVLFFLFIAFNMFRNFIKAAGKDAAKAAGKISPTDELSDIKSYIKRVASQDSNQGNSGGYGSNYDSEDWSFGTPKTQTYKGKARQKITQKSRKTKQGQGFDFSGRNGTNRDKNRQRRSDWGRRLQKEVLSGTNLFIVCILIFAGFYILHLY